MNNDKIATIMGVCAALPQVIKPLLAFLPIDMTLLTPILSGVSGLFLAILGYFANKKDAPAQKA